MSIISIVKVGEATKIVSESIDQSIGNTTLYTWREGRIIVKPNNEDIEVINEKVNVKDNDSTQVLKFSQQTEKYGTSNAIEFIEYLIVNDIFFLDSLANLAGVKIDGEVHQKVLVEHLDEFGIPTTASEETPSPTFDKGMFLEIRILQNMSEQLADIHKVLKKIYNPG